MIKVLQIIYKNHISLLHVTCIMSRLTGVRPVADLSWKAQILSDVSAYVTSAITVITRCCKHFQPMLCSDTHLRSTIPSFIHHLFSSKHHGMLAQHDFLGCTSGFFSELQLNMLVFLNLTSSNLGKN